MDKEYFSFTLDFCRLDNGEYWSATVHTYPEALGQSDARWHGCGRLDTFTLHDIRSVLDARIARAFYGTGGVQTQLDF